MKGNPMNKIHDHIDMMGDGRNFFVGAKNGLVITMAVVAMIAALMLCCGCEGDDSYSSNTNNYPPDIVAGPTNEVNEVVVSDLGDGNYVQINLETGDMTSVNVSNLRSNNAVIIDISNPVIPVAPTVPPAI
jgi:hypothetical protein